MTKLPKGIYKRGDGQFQVKLRLNGVTATKTFPTITEASKWAAIQRGRIVGGDFIDTTRERRTPLSDVLTRYLDEITPSKKGARQEASRIKLWLAEPLGGYAIGAVQPSDIADWIKARTAEGKAPSTVSNAVNLLSAVYKLDRTEWGYNVANPCTEVRRPKPRRPRFAMLSAEQQAHLLQACEDRGPPWLVFITRLALTTAMRAGEIRHLNWMNVHDDWLHLEDTKNGDARDVPLTAAAALVLADAKEALPLRNDGYVFEDPISKLHDHVVTHAFAKAAKDAHEAHGVPLVTYHDLRHVACTALSDYADDVVQLSKMTGHKSLQSLARYYNKSASDIAARMRVKEALQG